MTMNRPLAKIISGDILKFVAIFSGMQLFVIFLTMGYFALKDAENRAQFLVTSNGRSLGLMISIGDLFQLKNVVKSFHSDVVPNAWLLDANGMNMFESIDEDIPMNPSRDKSIIVQNGKVLVLTKSEIFYNDRTVGYLVLTNKINMIYWFFISFVLLLCSSLLIVTQSRSLEKKSLGIASYLQDLYSFFDSPDSEDLLNEKFACKKNSGVEEIENFATKLKEALVKIIRSKQLENEAAIGRITAGLTHDLRAPLGTFERLLETPDENLPALKPSVKDSLNRLYAMVDALRYSESENLIKRTISTLDFGFGADVLMNKSNRRHIKFKIGTEALSSLYIDQHKIERAWLNLASNAMDFAVASVKIEANAINRDLFIRVIDDGPGVPDEFLPKLFQRGATHGKHDGTGLGLAYVRQIMRGHGGDVRYYRENDMTVFECFLPNAVVEKEDKSESQAAEQPGVSQASQGNQPDIRQVSICFKSDLLNQRVHERLSKITTETHSFMTGFHQNSSIVLTDFEEMAETAHESDKRLIMFEETMSDDEIVRRAPIRLGLRG